MEEHIPMMFDNMRLRKTFDLRGRSNRSLKITAHGGVS
jgi:hypothetical protein